MDVRCELADILDMAFLWDHELGGPWLGIDILIHMGARGQHYRIIGTIRTQNPLLINIYIPHSIFPELRLHPDEHTETYPKHTSYARSCKKSPARARYLSRNQFPRRVVPRVLSVT